MDTKQPEALRLADLFELESDPESLYRLAAAELRRLHALAAGQATAAPAGDWLWVKLMDFCKKRGFAPANFSDLFEIVDAARAARAPADSVQEEAARLDFLIEQGAYVVSDPDACAGYWLHWARPDGSTWVQIGEYPTPRAAIDEARKQEASKEPDGSLPCGH